MGLFREAHFAFRGRRFVEWFFVDRPQFPVMCLVAVYSLYYLQYKYDLIARWKGEPVYNDYSYVKQAAERNRARVAALSSSPMPISPSSSVTDSLSSTGVN